MKDDVVNTQELLSALVDGELTGPELEQALALAEDAQGQANWQLYHLVGDVLRSPDLAHHSQHDLLSGLRAQLTQEPPLQALPESVAETAAETAAESVSAPRVAVASGVLEQVQAPALASAQQRDPAANASVFRWKLAAGFASIAAVAAVGWQVLMVQAPTAIAPQLAQTAAPNVVAVAAQDGKTVMLRDPNLDALLTLHEQYGTRPSLQVPAEFLRNAGLAHTSAQRTAP